MIIGTVKEIKNHEYRVGITPDNAKEYIKHGHVVLVETNAGLGANYTDQDYINVGAKIVKTATEIFDVADMIVKVKEFLKEQFNYLRKDQILLTIPLRKSAWDKEEAI